MTHEQN